MLKKKLGFKEALAMVLGRVIGSGIFRTPGPIMIAVAGLDVSKNYNLEQIPLAQVTIGFFLSHGY